MGRRRFQMPPPPPPPTVPVVRIAMLQLLRQPAARRYLLAWAQSSAGTGIGYVAILLLAHDTFTSPWAVTAVLLADALPAMTLGPVLGAIVDRVPRRRAAVAADVLGCAAFCGLAFASSFPLVVALAVLAGTGSALGGCAAMAGLPEVVGEDDLPSATSLYGVLEEAGVVLGPLVAAAVLTGSSPHGLLLVNGLSFAVSAALLLTVTFRPRTAAPDPGETLRASTRAGVRAVRRLPGVQAIILTSTAGVLAFGLVNVGELLFADGALGAGGSGFSLLVAAMSIGMTAGALAGSRSGTPRTWRREYLLGLLLMGVSLVAVAGLSAMWAVLPLLALCGYGNGITVTHERLLLQHTVPADLHGRVFGFRRMLIGWAFCGSYAVAGLIGSAAGPRWLMLIAGAGMLVAFFGGAVALRRGDLVEDEDPRAEPAYGSVSDGTVAGGAVGSSAAA